MEIQQQAQGAVTVLKPVGPLVSSDAETFRSRALDVARAALGRLVLDASGIPYVDSRGIEVLLDVTDELSASGRVLKLCAPNGTVKEVLDLTGAAESFEYFDDVTSAVRSFL
jgi:anti-sigma B factor antagonist